MGIMNEEIWQCKNCKFEFVGMSGCYEADPSDFGTTHGISPYYCPKCGNVKNLSNCVSFEQPRKGNEYLCQHDSSICEVCNTEMKLLKKPKTKIFQKAYLCPECKKKKLKFKEDRDEIWT